MVPCGLADGCNDHSFIDVTLTAGQTTTDIDPGDWYADAGTFPLMPNPITDLEWAGTYRHPHTNRQG